MDALQDFLNQVKEGRYGSVEESSLAYARMEAQTICIEDQYIYSMR